GLEWAGGLPGTVGGAIRGNAGCFGGEIKDVVKSVKSLDVETLREVERNFPDCDFGYRSSVFSARPARFVLRSKAGGGGSALGGKNSRSYNKEIILSAIFGFKKGDAEEIGKSVNEKIAYRRERHPLEYPNAGSIFKNIDAEKISKKYIGQFSCVIKKDPFPVVPAAYIISEAGLKGVSLGGAMISPKHPNFIVNVLEAKSSDVKNLIKLVKSEIKNKFDIELEEEIIAT
ncbi:UDP-N-acetylmuramate dehydrogenase, partial [Nocardioides sp.]|uniref:UDP-N-acetylmuramate dehydrogenase n=1 Tax=Nocardioides sp. TaxID=35761 RepID=UPI00273368B3